MLLKSCNAAEVAKLKPLAGNHIHTNIHTCARCTPLPLPPLPHHCQGLLFKQILTTKYSRLGYSNNKVQVPLSLLMSAIAWRMD